MVREGLPGKATSEWRPAGRKEATQVSGRRVSYIEMAARSEPVTWGQPGWGPEESAEASVAGLDRQGGYAGPVGRSVLPISLRRRSKLPEASEQGKIRYDLQLTLFKGHSALGKTAEEGEDSRGETAVSRAAATTRGGGGLA